MPTSIPEESMGSSASFLSTKKKTLLLCLLMSILGAAIAITFWIAIHYQDNKLLIVVLVLQILMSLIVGVLGECHLNSQ